MRYAICLAVFGVACTTEPTTNACGGMECSVDQLCVAYIGCEPRDQVEACAGLVETAPCTFRGFVGMCTEGVCRAAQCGNAVVDDGEGCDDGNTTSGDGCRSDCLKVEVCGDQVLDDGEGCDDGNANAGDGCGVSCEVERCGNSVVSPGEICDDGNNLNGDGCSADCASNETCGNGLVDTAVGEICDDGNQINGDGCEANCTLT